ncbi:MAG: SufE family protein [Alphaproteobacteria bacterium]|nr:SufE family protein [Alphaproteobacteria bacterium]
MNNALELKSIDELLEDFEFLDDWEERYCYVIDLGKSLPEMSSEQRTAENKVSGCMSQVWIISSLEKNEAGDDIIKYLADSDAFIVKGLVVILLSLFSNKTPAEVQKIDAIGVMKELGFDDHLTPTRKNGLYSMIARMKSIAAEY